ncbi:MAG: hypothetical protein HOL51_16245 [Gemmatimonadetes bacterium]|nr:hypothetical protein [Gemmatimonadota bacterium]MBT5327662.1 hypothetical protein [Gemmatimonadota bacterium]MBT5449814.1 hypothetical protein [Gemmatimonadota bacterium]MBT5800163.1 hypothetical protein [Gemmatimonadota bacterium]MBT6622373.1 hypothetical protein [Gemmatimonadota bacterium]
MSLFSDLFSARRRSNPRIAVDWMVDLAVPNTDPQDPLADPAQVGFCATILTTA